MYFNIDPQFKSYFRNLKQVFLYITDECNLKCIHCLYKPNLTFSNQNKEIKFDIAKALICEMRELGALKLTFIGGEPTLYDKAENNHSLLNLIAKAKQIGYNYVRISTNGQFSKELLKQSKFQLIDEIAFSLDGFSAEINDPLRGKGSFDRCIDNIRESILHGFKTSITCCIHNKLLNNNKNGNLNLELMIKFAESLNVNLINFHDLFKCGVPMDTWTGNINPSLEKWVKVYKKIAKKIKLKKYNISIRLPQCFITREEFKKNPKYYGYCPVKLGERVMIHPNGIIRICSNLICSPYHIAEYNDKRIFWNNSYSNEILDHKVKIFTPCTNRGKYKFKNYVPLCFSFKPNQDEFIWKNLKWDKNSI